MNTNDAQKIVFWNSVEMLKMRNEITQSFLKDDLVSEILISKQQFENPMRQCLKENNSSRTKMLQNYL